MKHDKRGRVAGKLVKICALLPWTESLELYSCVCVWESRRAYRVCVSAGKIRDE